jgi:multimeric flavodoxin WrbA
MKVVIINGSPRPNGNTTIAINEMIRVFDKNKVDYEVFQIGNKNIRGCVACNACRRTGRCAYNDVVNEIATELEDANGLVIATPVYYASANATLVACLDRLFYSAKYDKTMKVGASVVCGRRGGLSATFDQLNKYFSINQMPIVSSNYWNSIHGGAPGEAARDSEGLQTMRVLANNMIFLMRSIELGKEEFGLPNPEAKTFTNFIR